MILGFNPEFVPLILSGAKKQTIREDKKDRWSSYRKIHFVKNARTAQQEIFAMGIVDQCQPVLIDCLRKQIKLGDKHNGKWLNHEELAKFIVDDGFESIDSFFEFFRKNYKRKNNFFSGKVIFFSVAKEVGNE